MAVAHSTGFRNRWLAMVSNTHTEQKRWKNVRRPTYILFSEKFRQQLSDGIVAGSFQYRARYFLPMIGAADPSSFRIQCNSHHLYAPGKLTADSEYKLSFGQSVNGRICTPLNICSTRMQALLNPSFSAALYTLIHPRAEECHSAYSR